MWLSSEDQSKAFDFDVPYICLHAISKDPGTFPTPCIYCQVPNVSSDDLFVRCVIGVVVMSCRSCFLLFVDVVVAVDVDCWFLGQGVPGSLTYFAYGCAVCVKNDET